MRSLLAVLESIPAETIAVVGLAKNCGKTTTVNYLIEAFGAMGVRLGLTSIGRDGERIDLITRNEKPRIEVEQGTLAVTAENSLPECRINASLVARTGIRSALGELLMIRADGRGLIELSGPTTMEETRLVVGLLKESGAERVIVDGALDRLSSSSPSISDAVVLSGGAVLGASIEAIAARIAHCVHLFSVPAMGGDDGELIARVREEHGRMAAVISEGGNVFELDGSALLKCGELGASLRPYAKYLWVGGGVTNSIVGELVKCPVVPDVVVEDATRIFLTPMSLQRLRMAGGRIWVAKRIRLAAVTTNPVRPNGTEVDSEGLVDAVSSLIPGIPVYDVSSDVCNLVEN
jgi:hypothetical protein